MRRKIFYSLLIFLLLAQIGNGLAQQKGKPKTKPSKPQPQKQTPPPANPNVDAKPQAAKPPAGADDQWALIVGVSNYPGQIQKLGFPNKDARAIKDMLVKTANFRDDHIKLLTDDEQGAGQATKQNILAAIDQYLLPRVQANHQVIVFLAGHGIARGLGVQAKSYYLPVDVDASSKESLERTGLELGELSRHLSALKASQFTIFLDACREDPFPGRGIKGNTMTDVMTRGIRITAGENRPADLPPPTSIVFYACQVGERAYEDAKLEHGVFTYYILAGIQDLANKPDGRVEAGNLAAYLRENVRKWANDFQQTAKYEIDQTPTMVATDVRGTMVIFKIASLAKAVQPLTDKGIVNLVATPEDAKIAINGEALGSGNIQKELMQGQYTIRAERQGFQAVESKITVLPGVHQEVAITLKPVAANANYEKGVKFEAQGLMPQAVASYEMALQEDANSAPTYERLANVYLETGRFRDAVDLLSTATNKFADNVGLQARRVKALSIWARTLETQDQSTNARPDKAIKQKDARKEAVKTAETLTQKAPAQAEAQMALGYAYLIDEKDRQKAPQAFVRASTIAPNDAEAYFGVGFAYRLLKQYQQAVPQLNKALELRPDYYEAHRELAYCHHAMGNTDQAIHEYNVATGYRTETNNSGEMAGNHLALSALYVEKGQQVGGEEGKEIAAAGKGHETEARDYDPTLKYAMQVLKDSGVAYRMQSYLPSELRNVLNDSGVSLPGGVKLPFPKKKP
ncbi:MAG: caspase family protein [Acidobacteriota bacterium]